MFPFKLKEEPRAFGSMEVKNWMSTSLAIVKKDDNITEVARTMREHNCGSVIVVEEQRPIGILTDTDIVNRVAADGLNLDKTKAEDVMTHNPLLAHSKDIITDVSRRMNLAKIDRMPVVEDQKLIGVISTTDLKRIIRVIQKDLFDITR